MSRRTTDQLVERVKEQVLSHNLKYFSILFHGGEPMLWGIENFQHVVSRLREVPTRLELAITTNGILINDRWAQFFASNSIDVTVSVDGTPAIHDTHRRTFSGKGTYEAVRSGIRILKEHGVRVSGLAVYDAAMRPRDVYDTMTMDLGLNRFDVLIPIADHDNPPVHSISSFYRGLYDIWINEGLENDVVVRLPRAHLIGVLGGKTRLESIGYGAQETTTVLTDGSIEALDVLRFAGNEHTKASMDIFKNRLDEVKDMPEWQSVLKASLSLPAECLGCVYHDACGGGYLPHRYSKSHGYGNPSVYCAELKSIFSHIWQDAQRRVSFLLEGDQDLVPGPDQLSE